MVGLVVGPSLSTVGLALSMELSLTVTRLSNSIVPSLSTLSLAFPSIDWITWLDIAETVVSSATVLLVSVMVVVAVMVVGVITNSSCDSVTKSGFIFFTYSAGVYDNNIIVVHGHMPYV